MPFLPKDAAEACIRRSRRFLLTAAADLPDPKIRSDLRRAALVIAVAAIDSYMHLLIVRHLTLVRKQGDLPSALKKFSIPFLEFATIADHIVSSRKSKNKQIRPWVMVKNSLRNQLLKETYQSFEQINHAFALAGIKNAWIDISGMMFMPSEYIPLCLNIIIQRRNQIVHEGDIARAQRPRNLSYNHISNEEALSYIDWIECLLEAIEKKLKPR